MYISDIKGETMKLSLLLFLFCQFLFPLGIADDDYIAPFESDIKLKCSDPILRLSRKPIPCIPDNKQPSEFDIPKLRIDHKDLDKILQGAESSGGHTVSPMGFPSRNNFIPFNVKLSCMASLLTDGGKTLSFLSEKKFGLDNTQTTAFLGDDDWDHFVFEGNDFNSKPKFPLLKIPQKIRPNYSVTLSYKKEQKKLSLRLCRNNIQTYNDVLTSSCTYVDKSLRRKYFKTLLNINYRFNERLTIKKTMKVVCIRKI